MRHEMLTQRALFCHHANTKPGTLSQHFVTHVVPLHPSLLIDSNARERDWKRDHVRPLATIESQEIILATDRFLLWKLFLPAEAILGPVFNFLWNKTPLLIGT